MADPKRKFYLIKNNGDVWAASGVDPVPQSADWIEGFVDGFHKVTREFGNFKAPFKNYQENYQYEMGWTDGASA